MHRCITQQGSSMGAPYVYHHVDSNHIQTILNLIIFFWNSYNKQVFIHSFVPNVQLRSQSAEATLQTKHDLEHLAGTRGVKVKSYHADNGRFAERSFVNDVKRCLQRISFCGVGAHHQNGITENAIKQLTLVSCTTQGGQMFCATFICMPM